MNNNSLSSSEILKIKDPEELFEQKDLKKQLLKFRKEWHPDRNNDPDANDVMHHVQVLYDIGQEKLVANTWGTNLNHYIFESGSKKYRFKYLKKHKIDIGNMYINRKHVLFLSSKENSDLSLDAYLLIRNILAIGGTIAEGNRLFLPQSVEEFDSQEGHILLIGKQPRFLLLNDILEFVGGSIIPHQVAWIISSMYNLATWLEKIEVVHNEFTEYTYFIDPEKHSGELLGGWFYALQEGSKLKALPKYIKEMYPKKWLDKKQANARFMSMAIKATGLKLLGDPSKTGITLLGNKDIPEPMVNFLRTPPGKTVHADYEYWYDTVLVECYGKPKFRNFEQDYIDLYSLRGI